ncbi:MAG: DUF2326 domain-containing protein [Methanobacterium sp.]
MIHKICANDERFKEITFKKGLNVIMADSEKKSGKKDTRNGVGKTTLINIIDFCLGSNPNKRKLPIDKLNKWVFTMEIDIFKERFTVSRSIDNPNIIKIKGRTDKLPIKPNLDPEEDFLFYKNNDWKTLLGMCLFGIKESASTKYSPSFRSLISYFVRRDKAYDKPFKNDPNQKPWDIQISNAYLLGLNWVRVSESQVIKDKEKALKSWNSIIKEGFVATPGELEAERLLLEKEVKIEEKALSEFKVHPQYSKYEKDANVLSKEIHELSNQIISLNQKLDRYIESVSSENVPESLTVEELYMEAGMVFPDHVKKTLEDAKIFHKDIIKNRKEFLQTEIAEIKNHISDVERDKERKINKRASLLKFLKEFGALNEYTVLQERFSTKKEKLDYVKLKIRENNERALQTKKIKEEKIILETKFKRDYEEMRPNWEKAVTLFNENSVALYNEPGFLIIDVVEDGYKFKVDIPRSGSKGIDQMKIYCYDLMLVDLHSKQRNINFLIHDSTIYDSVDSRQRAHALEHAHDRGINNDFQYICTINSDMVPHEHFTGGFDINKHVRLKLTDKDPSNFLLGFEF